MDMGTTRKRDKGLWLSLLLLICSVCAMAEPDEFVCKKDFNYSYRVNNNYVLDLDNNYGKIVISHWDKDEVEIQINIITKARSEKTAQGLLDCIDAKVAENKSSIIGKTEIGKNNFSNYHLEINYFVNAPTWMNLKLKQRFGNIKLPQEKNDGSCQFIVKYGKMDAGDFSQPLSIEASFSNIQIGNVGTANIKLEYCSDSSIKEVGKLTLSDSFSTLAIGKVGKLKMNSSYGKLTIKQADEIDGKINFGHLNVKNLANSFLCSSQSYSDVNLEEVNADFETIRTKASFCKLSIGLPKSVSCKIKAYNFRYGNCKIDKGFEFTQDEVDNENNKARMTTLNKGGKGLIEFDGGNYGSLSVNTVD